MATTTNNNTGYTANEKRTRVRYRYTNESTFLRTKFPGHRARYLRMSSITDARDLYQQCANLWPEYFAASAPHPFSNNGSTGKPKGLLGIAFYHPEIRDHVDIHISWIVDFFELENVAQRKAEDHVRKMAEHRISASGPTIVDLKLVREGRDQLRVAGWAHSVNSVRGRLMERVIGEEERRGGKRAREVEEGEEDERPVRRQRR